MRGNRGDRWAQQVLDWLHRHVRRTRGKLTRITAEAGVSPDYLTERRREGTADLQRLCRLIDAADLDVVEVFAKALGRTPPTERPTKLLRPPTGPCPPVLSAARRRFDDPVEGSIPLEHLQRLDDLRYDDPAQAIEGVEASFAWIASENAPLAFGIYASCCKLLARVEDGWHALHLGMEIARRTDQVTGLEGTAMLLQRAAVLHQADGRYDRALSSSERASVLFARTGNRKRLGQTLVDQGTLLYHVEEHHEAEQAFQAGLRWLEDPAPRHRSSALLGIGAIRMKAGDFGEALEAFRTAEGFVGSRLEWAKLTWAQAYCYALLGSWVESDARFDIALENLASVSPIDSALCLCDQARLLLKGDRPAVAHQRALAMRQIIIPLEAASPAAAAAAGELVRTAMESRTLLTLELVEQISRRIDRARRAQTPAG